PKGSSPDAFSIQTNSLASARHAGCQYDGFSGIPTEHHKGAGDDADCTVHLVEDPRDYPGYRKCGSTHRFQPRAHADRNGGEPDCRCCFGLMIAVGDKSKPKKTGSVEREAASEGTTQS